MTEQIADNVIPFPTREEMAAKLEDVKFAEWIFTNDKANPYPRQLLHMLYDGALTNKLGIMHAKDAESGKEVSLIVGIIRDDEGNINCFPLARFLDGAEVPQYLAPDGEGGWVGEKTDDESDE
jgi:hypothetical protein